MVSLQIKTLYGTSSSSNGRKVMRVSDCILLCKHLGIILNASPVKLSQVTLPLTEAYYTIKGSISLLNWSKNKLRYNEIYILISIYLEFIFQNNIICIILWIWSKNVYVQDHVWFVSTSWNSICFGQSEVGKY